MIDFTSVTAITIPEGNVKKISRGTDVLWEKPSSGGSEPILVFSATGMSVMPWTPNTYINSVIVFTRAVSVGEKYDIYVNGTAHSATATSGDYDGTSFVQLYSDDGKVQLAPSQNADGTFSNTSFAGRLVNMTVNSLSMEIYYIPE